MSAYYTLVTAAGAVKIAAALATSTPMVIGAMAVGDGGGVDYSPSSSQTALVNEVWRAPVDTVTSDGSGNVIVQKTIPANLNDSLGRPSGGFTIREVGVFDSTGTLVLICKAPDRYKPIPTDGASDDMTIRVGMVLGGSTAAIQLVVASYAELAYAADTGAANSYTVAPPIPPTSYVPGLQVTFKTLHLNTGPCTLNISGLGAATLVHSDGSAIVSGDIPAGSIVLAEYDGTNFQVISATSKGAGAAQRQAYTYAADTGAANAYAIALAPARTIYATGQITTFKVANVNTGASTLNVNGAGARTIVRNEDGSALKAGDLVAGELATVVDDGANLRLIVLPSIGVRGWRNHQVFTASGTFTPPAGVTRVFVKVKGAGAGGGGDKTGSTAGAAGGGGEGGYAEGFVDVTPGAGTAVTVGLAGTGGINTGATAALCNGTAGSTSSFGAFISATGGSPGAGASATSSGAGGAGGAGTGGELQILGQQGDPAYTPDAGGGGKGGRGGGARGGASGNSTAGSGAGPGDGGAGGGISSAGAPGHDGLVEVFW